MFITVDRDTLHLTPGGEVILRNQTWQDYESLLALRGDRSLPKIYFHAIRQETRLMSPLPSHANRVDTLRDLVKSLLRLRGQDWQCFDPVTLRTFPRSGVEPDTCFYVKNRQFILGKERIDLTTDPPPDLAIEVDFTSRTNLEDYLPIAIPELWIYRLSDLQIYLFDGENYRESSDSLLFPDMAIKTLLPKYVELAWIEGSSVALRQFDRAIMSR
jgi:Uma2 family endonuclease